MTAALADPSIAIEGDTPIPEFSHIQSVPAPEPRPTGTKTGDPSAPYGRTKDGAPRGRPGPKKTTTTSAKKTAGASSSSTSSSAASTRATTSTPPPPAEDADPGPRALALMRFASTPLVLVGMAGFGMTRAYTPGHPTYTQGRALLADTEVLGTVLPDVCQGLDEVAQTRPGGGLARFLDKVAQASPYARLVGAITTAATQLAANHRLIPANLARLMGATDPDQLADRATLTMADEIDQMARAAAAA